MSINGNYTTFGAVTATGLVAFNTAINNAAKAGAVPYGTVAYSADATPVIGVKVGYPKSRKQRISGMEAFVGPLSSTGNVIDQLTAKLATNKFVVLADGLQGASHIVIVGYLA